MENTSIKGFFYPNTCYVCQAYGKNVQLRRCSSCQAIAYCGEAHRNKDWPEHKELCQALSGILEDNGRLYEKKETWNFKWVHARIKLIDLVRVKLGRQVTVNEREILQNPRSCEICHETNPSILNDCPDCPVASFCSAHPRDNRHSNNCKKFKLSFKTTPLRVGIGNDFDTKNLDKGVPKTIAQAIRLYDSSYRHYADMPKRIWSTVLADELSRAYTFLFALDILGEPSSETITIHVIGSTIIETATAYFWRHLLHHVQNLRELNIVFVGSELDTASESVECCSRCKNDNRRLNVQTVGDLYENFADSKLFTKPDYVFGFNLKIYISTLINDAWAPSLDALAELGCPFIMSSDTVWEATNDQDELSYLLGRDIEFLWFGKNPFSGRKPHRHCLDGFSYVNQYLTIYEKLS